MDFPRHHHHHHRREEDEYPPPGQPHPPPYYEPEPPPHVTHVYHSSHTGPGGFASPPPPVGDYGYPPPPRPPTVEAYTSVEHVSHHSVTPHLPSFMHHHSHDNSEITNRPSVRMYSKAEPNYSLTIRDGKVILAPSNPSDPFQHWIKDEKYSTKVKDEEGFPSFVLVNKATGQAMKHSIGATQPVQLTPYKPDVRDESILWTESRDLGDTYRAIRMVNNIRLNVDAFNGDQNHGGVRDGTPIVLWEWKKGDNQRWKILPY